MSASATRWRRATGTASPIGTAPRRWRDRHAAYVGMNRHRDGVALRYGRDDFVDQRQLVRALSRDRGKDMAGDYAPERTEQDRARAFPERREIRFPELAREIVAKVQAKARGMFAGLRPRAAPPGGARDREEGPGECDAPAARLCRVRAHGRRAEPLVGAGGDRRRPRRHRVMVVVPGADPPGDPG